MNRFFIQFLVIAPIGLLSLRGQAAPMNYNPALVAADSRWVLHADFNGFRASQIGGELVAALEKAQVGANGGIIGINFPRLLATIGTLTAYGTNLTPDPAAIDGTLIAQGTPDLRKIAESILLQGTLADPDMFSEVDDLPFPAYAISDPKAPAGRQMQLVIAFPPEPIVLVSKSKAQLIKARDVFRGSAPSLARDPGSPLHKLAASADGAYLFAASVVPTEPLFPEKAPQARILQLARSGSLALGERDTDAFAHAVLTASSDKNAEKLTKILEGVTAMLSLAELNNDRLADFLRSTMVTREKETVTLRLVYPIARLLEMSQNLQNQMKPRPTKSQPQITMGRTVAEWTAVEVGVPDAGENALSWRTIENVALTNGATITIGRALNGGKNARAERVEIVPEGGTGSALIFGSELMRQRGSMQQFAFPGVDGVYSLKVGFINDPEGKARFAVSVSEPKPAQPDAPARTGNRGH